jgi:hypothetical protein
MKSGLSKSTFVSRDDGKDPSDAVPCAGVYGNWQS